MDYYIGLEGRTATFILRDESGRQVARVVGHSPGDSPLTVDQAGVANPAPYPLYEIVTVDGITELIEHRRMEPIFYITDDPVVKRKLGVQ